MSCGPRSGKVADKKRIGLWRELDLHFKISLYKNPSPNSTTAFWQHTAAGARSGGHQAPVLAPIQNPLSPGIDKLCSEFHAFIALFLPIPHNLGGRAGANKPNFVWAPPQHNLKHKVACLNTAYTHAQSNRKEPFV